MGTYASVKRWRNRNKKNRQYSGKFMKAKRKYYKQEWDANRIKYEDIPVSYRYWKDHERIVTN